MNWPGKAQNSFCQHAGIEELERVRRNCTTAAQQHIQILQLDLSAPETLDDKTKAAIVLFGHIDILVNNGGISQRSLIQESTIDVYRRLMEVNYFGAIALSKGLLPHFVSRKAGHFVTISSVTGKFGTPFRSGYAAAKHALHGFFDSMRAEHWKDNIVVTMICPGFINTPISLAALKGDGSPLNEADKAQGKGKPAEWCAKRIVRAIEKKREEVYIGGKEVLMVYIKRFFPSLFSKIIRKVAVR